ncbi:hypothetical protein [Methanocaldococcus sp.]
MKKIFALIFGLLVICSTLASVSAVEVENSKDIAGHKVDIEVVKNTPTDQIVKVNIKNINDFKKLYITKIIKKRLIKKHIMVNGETYCINIKAKKLSEDKYCITETIYDKNEKIANLNFTVKISEKNYIIKTYNVNIINNKKVAIINSVFYPNPNLDLYINVGSFGNIYGDSTEYSWSNI